MNRRNFFGRLAGGVAALAGWNATASKPAEPSLEFVTMRPLSPEQVAELRRAVQRYCTMPMVVLEDTMMFSRGTMTINETRAHA